MQFKLAKKYAPVMFAFYMSAMMAWLMCMVIVAVNAGVDGHYIAHVLKAYMLAMPSAFVLLQLVRPLVTKLVAATVSTQ